MALWAFPEKVREAGLLSCRPAKENAAHRGVIMFVISSRFHEQIEQLLFGLGDFGPVVCPRATDDVACLRVVA